MRQALWHAVEIGLLAVVSIVFFAVAVSQSNAVTDRIRHDLAHLRWTTARLEMSQLVFSAAAESVGAPIEQEQRFFRPLEFTEASRRFADRSDYLLEIEQVALFGGEAERRNRALLFNDRAKRVSFGNACAAVRTTGFNSQNDCEEFMHGIAQHGLHAAIELLLRDTRALVDAELDHAASALANATPMNATASTATLRAESAADTFTLLTKVVQPLLITAANEQLAAIGDIVDSGRRQAWATFGVLLAAVVLITVTVIHRSLKKLDNDLKHSRGMLLLLPPAAVLASRDMRQRVIKACEF